MIVEDGTHVFPPTNNLRTLPQREHHEPSSSVESRAIALQKPVTPNVNTPNRDGAPHVAANSLKWALTAPAEYTPEEKFGQNTSGPDLAIANLPVTGDSTAPPKRVGKRARSFHREASGQQITAQRETSQEIAKTSLLQKQPSSGELAARNPYCERGTQLPHRIAVRPQYREGGDAPMPTGDGSKERPVTPVCLPRDVIPHHQWLSSSHTAKPELGPSIPSGNTTPHRRQPSRKSTISTRPGRRVCEK